MLNAMSFIYDGVSSAQYGLVVASFNAESVGEVDLYSYTLNTIKPSCGMRNLHGGIALDDPQPFSFSVVSEREISADKRSEILSWLLGRNSYRPLVFNGIDNGWYTYYAVFTSVSGIYVNGICHGFNLSCTCDSAYARGNPIVVIAHPASGGAQITINNTSNVVGNYIYPRVEFRGNVDIVNITDDPNRHFVFDLGNSTEGIVVDNEIHIIRGIDSNNAAKTYVDKFNKNWLRLRHGINVFNIQSANDVKITCPLYYMIGY